MMIRLFLSLALALYALAPPPAWSQQDPAALQNIRSKIQSQGSARVIVGLRLHVGAHVPEGLLSGAAVAIQRQDIASVGAQVVARVQGTGARVFHRYDSLPFVAMEVNAAGLAQLQASSLYATSISEDPIAYPTLHQSGPLVQADQAWAAGFDGTGWTVAIIDTGTDKTHPFLLNKVVSEACYVNQLPTYYCPNGLASQVGSGAAVPFAGQHHGTHVSGIAAGNGPNAVPPPSPMMSGMARGASIIAVNVFGASSYTYGSDMIAGLNRVYALRSTFNIASANMSIGGGLYSATCDTADGGAMKTAIDQLRSVNIATVIAAGNNGSTNSMSWPGCVSTAISVGSTDKSDVVSSFSNATSFMSLWAPGSSILSSVIGGGYGYMSGTSMATPHVTGTWAVLKQANPSATVTQILTALQSTGKLITDARPGGTVTKPRINIVDALAQFGSAPTGIAPTNALLGATLNVTITGTGFVSGATTSFGAGITVNSTTFNSSTQLTANITIAANATPGTRTVSVTNPSAGTGNLANAFTINAPVPAITTLSPNPVIVGGGAVTLTVNGTGFATTSVVRINGTARTTTSVSATQLTATILAADIATAGPKSITVFTPTPGGGTSGAVSLNVNNPAPTLTSIAPATLPAWGPDFTLTVNGANFVASSVVQVAGSARITTFVNSGQLTAAVPASDIATAAATMAITVSTPTPGGGTSGAVNLVLTQPSIAVSAVTVPPSTAVTATLNNPPGGAQDWIALAAVGAANTTYLQYAYVTSLSGSPKTWTVPMPAALGTYEFRLFLNNGYARASTGPAVTVASINATPTITALTPAGVAAGSASFALTVNGTGFVSGATATVGGVARVVTAVSTTQLTVALLAADGAAPGTVAVVVTNPPACAGGVCVSNSVNLAVTAPPPVPTLTSISPTTAAAGGAAFTLTAAGANFAPNSVVQVNGSARTTTFVSATQLTATILASDIASAGTPGITVFTPAPGGGTSAGRTLSVTGPGISVSATTSPPGGPITATLANSPGGSTDWLGLALVGAPDSSYLQWTYVGAGVTARTWPVPMPAALGTYEFRLFLNNGYARAATSPAVTVSP